MSSTPSARPPSSRRQPDLDSREARAFVERAAGQTDDGAGEGASVHPRPTVAPIERARREVLRPLTLRIPESLHSSLLYIAEHGNRSMNQFVIEALSPAVKAQIDKIERRRALGLD